MELVCFPGIAGIFSTALNILRYLRYPQTTRIVVLLPGGVHVFGWVDALIVLVVIGFKIMEAAYNLIGCQKQVQGTPSW